MEALPNSTAVTTALWRASHLLFDSPPYVVHDRIGLDLASPASDWETSPRVAGVYSSYWRASCLARARFAEDLAVEQAASRDVQCVILGAGLDSFAQRRPATEHKLHVFEVDQPDTQVWKRARLQSLGLDATAATFVPVDFESDASWLEALEAAGFDRSVAAVVASSGVTQYISREASMTNLNLAGSLAPGSLYACSYMRPPGSLADAFEREQVANTAAGAAQRGHPWITYLGAGEFEDMARGVGFAQVETYSAERLYQLYFSERSDGLRPSSAEGILLATAG